MKGIHNITESMLLFHAVYSNINDVWNQEVPFNPVISEKGTPTH